MKLKKPHRLRVVLLALAFCGLASLVAGRLYVLQVMKHDVYLEKAERQNTRRVVIHPERGDILDRNGAPLAQSTERYSVYINSKYFRGLLEEDQAFEDAVDQIARQTGAPKEAVRADLSANGTRALAKRVHKSEARVLAGILDQYDPEARGHWLDRISNRVYPKSIASPIIGFCQRGVEGDNNGLSGLELYKDEALRGRQIVGRARWAGANQAMEAWEPERLFAAQGNTVTLTIDARIQEDVEKALAEGVIAQEGDAGGAVVIDTETGGVLAMASYPTYDNNRFGEFPPDHRRNRPITDPIETGSVIKLFTAAILIDAGYVSPDTVIDCEGGFAIVDGRRLRDSPGHYLDAATFRQILRNSSNIGIVKAARVLENEMWHAELKDFGFGEPTGIDLPGEEDGILRDPSRWTKFSRTSLPMGYEIGVTPLQVAAGIAAMVNGGRYFTPHVVKEIRDPKGTVLYSAAPEPDRRVIRPTTSAIMRDLMEDIAVLGTGKKARVPGHRIGGKTGTTRKSDVFHKREYISSFAGALPIHNPRVAIYVYVDDPKKEYYASAVAAPIFKKIAESCILHLGVTPSEPVYQEEDDSSLPLETLEDLAENAIDEQRFVRSAILGRMPDFRGLSMSEARSKLPQRIDSVKFMGTGTVKDQNPPPGDPFDERSELVLFFSNRTSSQLTAQTASRRPDQ